MRRITFQSKNGQKVLIQRLVAERRERLADAHHVGFGDADVQRAPLIDGGDAGLEPARRRQVGIDRDDAPDRARTPSSPR